MSARASAMAVLALAAVLFAQAARGERDQIERGCREFFADPMNTVRACSVVLSRPRTPPAERLRAYQIRGNAYLVAGDPDAAIGDFSVVIDALPKGRLKGYLHFLRGSVWLDHKPRIQFNTAKAAGDLETADLMAPGNLRILEQLSRVRLRLGETKAAADAASTALDINPNSIVARRARARAYEALGHFTAARWDVDKLIRKTPRTGPLLAWRGRLNEKSGSLASALDDYRAAARLETTEELLLSIRRLERQVRPE